MRFVLFLERERGRVRVRIWINFECTFFKFSQCSPSKSVRAQRHLLHAFKNTSFARLLLIGCLFSRFSFAKERERRNREHP